MDADAGAAIPNRFNAHVTTRQNDPLTHSCQPRSPVAPRHEGIESIGDLLDRPFHLPPDIQQALQANEPAWSNLRRWPEAYLRIRVAHVDHARDDPAEFETRLRTFIDKSRQGKQFGFGIEAFY